MTEQLIREFGFPTLVLIGVGWFLVFKVWPLIVKSVERWLDGVEMDRAALVESHERRDAELARLNELVLEALTSTRAVISETGTVIQGHTDAIRELVGLVRLDSQRRRHFRASDDDISEAHG